VRGEVQEESVIQDILQVLVLAVQVNGRLLQVYAPVELVIQAVIIFVEVVLEL